MDKLLTGTPQSVELDPGYRVRTPGWKGKAKVHAGGTASTRSVTRGMDAGSEALDDALRNTDVATVRQIELELAPTPAAAAGVASRSAVGLNQIELEVPPAGPGFGQLVVSIDDAGAVRWHLPVSTPDEGAAASRGGGAGVVFRIPVATAPAETDPAAAASRSILGAVGRRLLKVLVYPITDPVVGKIADLIAHRWEEANRPHRLRHFSPEDYGSSQARTATAAEIEKMAKAGSILLFVHGTFSTAHGGFGGLPKETMQALHAKYQGRVIAFDHPTLSVNPFENVRWLVTALPRVPVVFDIVCHSRGGLVSRVLAEAPSAAALPANQVTVRKLVLGAAPNAGTLLADPDHMVSMIDRLTTALMLLPTGAVAETLEALITVVKTLGHGGLKGLDGLCSMLPSGPFLAALNAGGSAGEYFAIAANFEPTDKGLRLLVTGGANAVVDQIFGDADNDLVVPTEGVYETNGHVRFPVPAANRIVLDRNQGTMHTTVFEHPQVSRRLLAWL